MIVFMDFGCKKENLKDADLLKSKWVLFQIQDTKTNAMTHYPNEAAKKISIVFSDSSNSIVFSGVCNGGTGKYSCTSGNGEIKITDLFTTLIGCNYSEWETYTVQNLYYAFSYEINGTTLAIYSKGTYNLYFTKN
jgi:heat shock protein HslJ